MQPITISKNLVAIKKCANQSKKPWKNTYQQIKDNNGENKGKNNNDIFQKM